MAAAILATVVAVVARKSAAGSPADRVAPARQTVQHSFASAWAAAAAAAEEGRIPLFLAPWFGHIPSTAAVVQTYLAVPNQPDY